MGDRFYRVIDHTADFGVHVFGRDLEALFFNAAFALFDQLVDRDTLRADRELSLCVDGKDWPDLMVGWLRELLYLWTGRELLAGRFRIRELAPYRIAADVGFDPYSPERHEIKTEIKAVTYHQIAVIPVGDRWEAKIIFDI